MTRKYIEMLLSHKKISDVQIIKKLNSSSLLRDLARTFPMSSQKTKFKPHRLVYPLQEQKSKCHQLIDSPRRVIIKHI